MVNQLSPYHQVNTQRMVLQLYPTKKKRNSKIFTLISTFNAKMRIAIKYLFLIKSSVA